MTGPQLGVSGGFSLESGQTREGVLCYQVPIDDEGLVLFYIRSVGHWYPTLGGFWAASSKTQPPTPVSTPPTISDTRGTLTSPIPLGETALASDGVAITVVSANLDADDAAEEALVDDYIPPPEGTKYMTVRARIEDFSGGAVVRSVASGRFGLVTPVGLILDTSEIRNCGFAYDAYELFKGGWIEIDLCFEAPREENAFTLFYDASRTYLTGWRDETDKSLGFWSISADRVLPIPAAYPGEISDIYGTPSHPVPVGETAQTADGMALTVKSVRYVPEESKLSVRVRLEYFDQHGLKMHYVDGENFGLLTYDGWIISGNRHTECAPYVYSFSTAVFKGGWREGDVCFDITRDDRVRTLFYWQAYGQVPEGTERVLGFWSLTLDQSELPPMESPLPISDAYGTLANPVPIG